MTGAQTFGDAAGQSSLLGDRYRLIRPIGSGGMAVVWEARDEVLNRTVAVKVLAGRHLGDPQSRELIRQEARAAAALSHPNIAQVHDYGETATTSGIFPYVVMELVRGDTLETRASRTPVTPRFAMRVCAEVAAALAAAHAEGIVHRDVKPANVMLAPTGAKVVDFGIAAAVAPGRTDDDFEVLGTPAYLAPERLISDVVEPASDVYALAILLYQLLAGCLPWTSESTTQMLSAHIYVDPEPLGPTSGVPGYVIDLCNRCLAKDPTLRPSAREVAAVLSHGAQAEVATTPTPDPGTNAPTVPPPGPQTNAPSAPPHDARADAAAAPPPDPQTNAPTAPPYDARTNAPTAPPYDARTNAATAPPQDARADAPTVLAHDAQADGPTAGNAAAAAGGVVPAAVGGAAAADGALASASAPRPSKPEDHPPPAATPEGQSAGAERPSRVRRWAVAAGAAALIVAAWALWPHSGRSAGAPSSGAEAVWSPSAAPGAGVGTSPSPAASPSSPGPVRGQAAATPVGTVTPPRTAHPSAPTTAPTRTATPTTAPPTTGDPAVHKLTSTGGSVKATCPAASTAQILSAKRIKPFKVFSVDTTAGPAPTAVFKQGKTRITMTVTCQAGEPSTDNTVSG